MRVLLVGPDYEENLSIRYLSSSLLAAGHETTLAAFNSCADTTLVANAARHADVVGLSMCFQSRAQEFLGLARLIKSRHSKQLIVAGGHYASCAAEPLLAHHPEIDIIVIHEGEGTLLEIIEAVPRLKERLPQIPGIAYRDGAQVRFTLQRRTLDDLDALPFPDRRGPIHSIAGVPTSYMMGSRGCYGTCAYCCITTLHQLAPGKRFRQRNVEAIADEMAALYQERRSRQFVFHDDNFLVPSEALNHARISAFEGALKKRGVKDIALVIKCRPADANRRVLRRLKDLGLVRVFLGVESATPRGLSTLERTQSVEDSELALETCADLGISAQFTLMIFHPDATLDTLRSDVAFMRRFCGNPLNFCRAEIYAGTPLEKRMIALGRARGDYLARVYNLSDPVADLACNISLDLFESRCWSNGSLMQSAIGLDHLAAVRKRFDRRPSGAALCGRVATWLRSVNLETTNVLEEVIDLSASTHGIMDADVQRALLGLRERESATCLEWLSRGENLREELERFHFPSSASQLIQIPGTRLRFARQFAAAVLAIGLPATAACQSGVSEMAPPPLKETQNALCSLTGTVTDSTGAVVPRVKVTVTNLDTGVARTSTTNETGQYVAGDLQTGRYSVKAAAQGFKITVISAVELKPGQSERVDVRLQLGGDYGCCEYAASPLKVAPEDLTIKKKPFTYTVGDEKDNGTLKGIADLVYGDPNMWVQIFEANRDVIDKPSDIPNGTSITIPVRRRDVPKLISKVLPAYPAVAKQQHVWGDVVLDVTLKENGTVEQTSFIAGDPLLVEAATSAVKQWRYRPLTVKGKLVVKLVVVVSFSKGGKVQ